MKYIIGLVGMLLPLLSGAQSPPIKPLKVGDMVPDIFFNQVTNYKTTTARLSDFKGNLVLLDFWSTWCGACIKGFPKMDSLKKQYSELQVLLVNTKSNLAKDDEVKIQKTFKNIKQRTGNDIQLPVVYNSPMLDALFPVLYLPQVIWVKNNRVIAITGSDEVTAENITQSLSGITPDFHMKKDQQQYDWDAPLFIKNNGGNGDQMLFRSILTRYIEGIGSRSGYRVNNQKITAVYFMNHSLLALTKKGFDSLISYQNNRIIIESKNKGFLPAKNEELKYANSYCYELIIPPSTEKQVREYMQDDLKRYFGITVLNEMRKMKCLVLSRKDNNNQHLRNRGQRGLDLEADSKKKFIYNTPLTEALRLLNGYSSLPLINETGLNTNVSIDLPFDLTDVQALQKAFAKEGFDLKAAERVIEVVVIADTR